MSIGKYVKKYVKKFYFRIKILDPIINKSDNEGFIDYLNSIKMINKDYIQNMVTDLINILSEIKKNKV